jgi:hypothetical protein
MSRSKSRSKSKGNSNTALTLIRELQSHERSSTFIVNLVLATLIVVATIVPLAILGRVDPWIMAAGGLGLVISLLSLRIVLQWDRAIVLRLGRFRGLRGPGVFWMIPIIDRISRLVAVHLRAMNMLYEGLKDKGSMIIVPSTAVETMNLGAIGGLAGLSSVDPAAPAARK